MSIQVLWFSIFVFIILSFERNLTLVHEIIRHGARSPGIPIPNMNWDDWPMGPKMLTPMGLRQQYVMGRFIRDRYVDQYLRSGSPFLDEEYNPYQIFVRASSVNRTVESAIAQMMGVYGFTKKNLTQAELEYALPPLNLSEETKNIVNQLGFQPMAYGQYRVPIHVFNKSNDSYYGDACPYADFMLDEEFNNSTEVKDIVASKQSIINTMLKAYGYDSTKADFDTIMSLIFAVPMCVFDQKDCRLSSTVIKEIQDLVITLMPYKLAYSTYYSRMRSTLLLKELLSLYSNVINTKINLSNSNDVLKGYFVFTHDDTIMTLARALNLTQILNSGVPFASSIIFELYVENDNPKNKSDFSIVSYFNMDKLLIPGCSVDPCPFVEFEQALKNSYIDDAENLCQTPLKY